jgi:hypothetical protein
MEHGNDRYAAELDLLERRVPGARMNDALGDAALGDLREVEAGAEMIAGTAQHDCAGGLGQVDKAGVELCHERIAHRVAFRGAIQAHVQHRAAGLDHEQVEPGEERRHRAGRVG